MKRGHIRRSQGLDKLGRHVVAMSNSSKCFLIDCVSKNDSFVSERDLAMSKNINFSLVFLQLSVG